MEEEQLFQRLAAFIRAWFAVSLARDERQFAKPGDQVDWVGTMALFAADIIERRVASGTIERRTIEDLDETLEPDLAAIFAIQANTALMPYLEFIDLCASKVALAVEMLTPEDRKTFLESVRQGPDVELERLAELLGRSVRDVISAWGRIRDTLSVDPVIDDCMFVV